jgi:hypothetical protein
MLADSFRRIRPRQWLRKAVRTWLGLFAQRLFPDSPGFSGKIPSR